MLKYSWNEAIYIGKVNKNVAISCGRGGVW